MYPLLLYASFLDIFIITKKRTFCKFFHLYQVQTEVWTNSSMEQVTRIELASQPWQGRVLTIVLHLHWRARPDLNQRSGSCSPVPYHLATDPSLIQYVLYQKKLTITIIFFIILKLVEPRGIAPLYEYINIITSTSLFS